MTSKNSFSKIQDILLAKPIYYVLGIGFVILLWFLLALGFNSTLFPDPVKSFSYLGYMLTEQSTWTATGNTLLRLLISFASCLLLAIILGTLAGINKQFYAFLNPLIVVLRTVPTATVIFILIVLLKPAFALYIVVGLLIFPVLYQAVASGIQNLSPAMMDAVRMDAKVNSKESIFFVVIPSIRHSLFLGIIQALGLGMKITIMSEILCGTDQLFGIGRVIYHGYIEGNMLVVFSMSIIAIVLIGIFDILLSQLKKKIN